MGQATRILVLTSALVSRFFPHVMRINTPVFDSESNRIRNRGTDRPTLKPRHMYVEAKVFLPIGPTDLISMFKTGVVKRLWSPPSYLPSIQQASDTNLTVETELVWSVVMAETELEDQLLSDRVSARAVRAACGDPSGHQQFTKRQRLRVRVQVCAKCKRGRRVHEDVRNPILRLQSSRLLRSSGDARMACHFAGARAPVHRCQDHHFPRASGSCLPRHRDLRDDHFLHGFQQNHLGQ